MARRYNNAGIDIEDRGFSVDDLLNIVNQAQQYNLSKSANTRAETQLQLAKEQHTWQMKQAKSSEAAVQLYNKYSSEGYSENMFSDDFSVASSQPLPNAQDSFEKYQDEMRVIGKEANRSIFMQDRRKTNISIMQPIISQLNAAQSKLQNQGYNENEVRDFLKKEYNADTIYENAWQAYGQNPNLLPPDQGALMYQPAQAKRSFWDKIRGTKPELTGPSGTTYETESEFTGTEAAVTGGVIARGVGYGATQAQMNTLVSEATDLISKYKKRKPSGAPKEFLNADQFKKEFKITKSAANQMGKKELAEFIRKRSWNKTTMGKFISGVTGTDYKEAAKNLKAPGWSLLKGTAGRSMGVVGKYIDEKAGTGDTAQTVGTGVVVYNTLPPRQKAGFLKFLAKRGPAIMRKRAAAAAARHVASATTGVGATPWVQGALLVADIGIAGYSIIDLISEYQREE